MAQQDDLYDLLAAAVAEAKSKDDAEAARQESEPLVAFDTLRLLLETSPEIGALLVREMVEEAKKIKTVKTFHALFLAIPPGAECQYKTLLHNKTLFHHGATAARGAMIISSLHTLRKAEMIRTGRFAGKYLAVTIVQDRGSNVLALGIAKSNPHQ
jgi:hypothetical protein